MELIDFALEMRNRSYEKNNDFFTDEEDMRAAFEERSHCTVEDKGTMFRLDIKGVYDEMDERTIKNRKMVKFDTSVIYIASPEDTIANKLLFSREQDLNI
jgi:hypothetical protein